MIFFGWPFKQGLKLQRKVWRLLVHIIVGEGLVRVPNPLALGSKWGGEPFWGRAHQKRPNLRVSPAIILSSNIVFSRRPHVCVRLQNQLGDLKLSTKIMRKNMLFSGEIYTNGKKLYTSSVSNGTDKSHLWERLNNKIFLNNLNLFHAPRILTSFLLKVLILITWIPNYWYQPCIKA